MSERVVWRKGRGMSMERQEAVYHLRAIVCMYIGQNCVNGAEIEHEEREFTEAMAALGVTCDEWRTQ